MPAAPAVVDSHLPVLASSRELVTLPRPSPPIPLVDLVLGLVVAITEGLRGALGKSPDTQPPLFDAALELTWQGWSLTSRTASTLGKIGSPVARLVVNPPFVPTALRPVSVMRHSAAAWQQRRPAALTAVTQATNHAVPALVDVAVDSIDLTELVTRRVDLGLIVSAALDELDLTEIVLSRVDLDQLVEAVLDGIDLDSVARERMDLMGLAEYIVDGIDLPGIIRESTGSVASETVRSVRMQSIDADEAVQRVVERILLWRRGRSVSTPAPEAAKTIDETQP